MAAVHDSLLRAILALAEANQLISVIQQGMPWQCCVGAVQGGPAACTCWQPVYDLDQTEPTADTVTGLAAGTVHPDVRDRMCGDCAYRAASPERTGSADVAGDPHLLEKLAATGERFWCHDGMRTPLAWSHPSGIRIPAAGQDADYQPVIIDSVPYRADGRPGLLCAGWAARRRWHQRASLLGEDRAVRHG